MIYVNAIVNMSDGRKFAIASDTVCSPLALDLPPHLVPELFRP